LHESIREGARAEFLRLLSENGRRVRGVTKSRFLLELERSRSQVLEMRDRARAELDELQEKAAFLRGIRDIDQEALVRQERDFAETHEREFRRRMQKLFALAARGEIDWKDLEGLVVALTTQAAQEERERTYLARRDEYDRHVDQYERRIKKLNGSLQRTEQALNRLSRLKNVDDDGIASIYRTVQGLQESEDNIPLKKTMMQHIFEANLSLQQRVPPIEELVGEQDLSSVRS
jgi:predicted  nucleic acid-binding Zn-ribbon protein